MGKEERGSKEERGRMRDAKRILGLEARTIQEMAARNELPGTAKIGRCWTFDLPMLRDYVKQKVEETWQRGNERLQAGVSGKVVRFTAGCASRVRNPSSGRSKRAIRRLRENVAKLEKQRS